MLQRLWESGIDWDDSVPTETHEVWKRWYSELPKLRNLIIPRCYFPTGVAVKSLQLHGFSDASEVAYAGVVYIRIVDCDDSVATALVIAKTKVAPIKRITVPRLELCGAVLAARLLRHVAKVLDIPDENIHAWTDSVVVLSWLRGNPRRFKTFVGNRVSEIIDFVSCNHWHHVSGTDNPADSASRGIYPDELVHHDLWWNGPDWLREPESCWPAGPAGLLVCPEPLEERTVDSTALLATTHVSELPLLNRVSSYTKLKRITAWVLRFVHNCRHPGSIKSSTLSSGELQEAERYWIATVQQSAFLEELEALKSNQALPRSSRLRVFHPIVDEHNLLRIGGRISLAQLPCSQRHPLILPKNHDLVPIIIRSEHLRLLHAGPTLVTASLARKFCIIRGRGLIRSVIHGCVTCNRVASKPKSQILGQLPLDRLKPGATFDRVGIDYAGPVLTKSGPVRRPVITKAYIAVFVCFATKAVHLELVTDLTSAAFIAALRRFIARRGKPSIIWSDHGTNFVGAAREIRELYIGLRDQGMQQTISNFCASEGVQWKFTPEQAPHFGGLWEAAVKSLKKHMRRVVGEVKLTYEELSTILAQIEACLNSRPLTPLPDAADAIEVLTPGHFLIGRPLMALPDQSFVRQPLSLLRRWHLCQTLTNHLWKRWSTEYICHLQKFSKWHKPSRNLCPGDVVCLREEPTTPSKWPLARIEEVHTGPDGKVRVVTVRTSKGAYKRPVTKIVPLVSEN